MENKYIVCKKVTFSDIEGKAISYEKAIEVNDSTSFKEIREFIDKDIKNLNIVNVKIIPIK